jgi:hypothetical protein
MGRPACHDLVLGRNGPQVARVLPSGNSVVVLRLDEQRRFPAAHAPVDQKGSSVGSVIYAGYDSGKKSPNSSLYLRSASPPRPVRENSMASRIMKCALVSVRLRRGTFAGIHGVAHRRSQAGGVRPCLINAADGVTPRISF